MLIRISYPKTTPTAARPLDSPPPPHSLPSNPSTADLHPGPRPRSAGCPASPSDCGADYRWQGVVGREDPNDACHDHGTHCASTVGGGTYGVAKETTIIAVQACRVL